MQTEAEKYQFAALLAARAAEFETGIAAAAPPAPPIRVRLTAGGETTDITFQRGVADPRAAPMRSVAKR